MSASYIDRKKIFIMKKSKLLIPALSVASVGAVVAPMVTSCTKAGTLIEFQTIKYDSTTKAPKAQAYTCEFEALKADDTKFDDQDAMVKAYNNAVNGNSKIFADDFMYTYTEALTKGLPSNINNQTITFKNAAVTGTFLYDSTVTSLVSADIEVKNEMANKDDYVINYSLVNVPYTLYFKGTYDLPSVTLVSTAGALKDGSGGVEDAILAFLVSGFSITVSLKVTDHDDASKEYANVSLKVEDPLTLKTFVDSDDTEIASLVAPLAMNVTTNYFKNATRKS